MEFKESVVFFPGENRSDVSSRVTYEKKKRGVKKYRGKNIYIYNVFRLERKYFSYFENFLETRHVIFTSLRPECIVVVSRQTT